MDAPCRALGAVALLVREYDEAVAFFTRALGFRVVEDTDLGGGKRWLRLAPSAGGGTGLLLARAVTDAQRARIGDQAGGRVFLFLDTDDLARDLATLRAAGAAVEGDPRDEPYGRVVVFRDLYGNRWDLIQRSAA
jgi:catechol 2,3-dioxygenase-like lactoylglutathione lyase family enzyme